MGITPETYPTPADEKALAMVYAYTALVRTLCLGGQLQLSALNAQIASAGHRLDELGETGAASFLSSLLQSLEGVDR